MLRPKKRISKKELKQDTLVTSYVKAVGFYDKYKRAISIGVTAVAVVLIAVVIYSKNRSENNVKASAGLSQVMGFFDGGQYQVAIDGVPERNIQGLRSLVENYGNSPNGEVARFYLASAQYQLGAHAEALQNFEDFSPRGEILAVSRYADIAACHEALGRPREAAEYFEKAASASASDMDAPEYLGDAARNYAAAGDRDRALELYRKLKKNFPASAQAREADRFITQLTVS